MHKERIGVKRLLTGFLLSYISVFLIPLLLGIIIYGETQRMVKKDIINNNMLMLEQIRDVVDGRLKEITKMATQLSLNPKVSYFSNIGTLADNQSIYYNIWDFTRDLKSYTVTDEFVSSFFIWFRKSNMVITPNTSYRLSSFYGRYFSFGDMPEQQWHNNILERYHQGSFLPASPIFFEARSYTAITYIQSFPLSSANNPRGSIVILIDENTVKSLIKRICIFDTGWAYIADDAGRMITFFSKDAQKDNYPRTIDDVQMGAFVEKNIEGKNMTVVAAESSFNRWKYVAVLPSDSVMSKVNYIKSITITTIIVSVILSIFMSFYLSYRKTRPLKEIIQTLVELFGFPERGNNNVYTYVKNRIKDIAKSNQILENSMRNQAPLLRAAFFDHLLNGQYRTNGEIATVLSHIGLDILEQHFAVLLINTLQYGEEVNCNILRESDAIRVIVRDIITETPLNGKSYLHYIDESKIALLLCLEAQNCETCITSTENFIAQISRKLSSQYNIHTVYGAGRIYEELVDISCSYSEAKQVLDFKSISKTDDILWYHEIPKTEHRYDYNIDCELRLMNYVKTGNKKALERVLDQIYGENITKRKLPMTTIQQLMSEIHGTVYKLSDHSTEDQPIQEISNEFPDVDSMFTYLRSSLKSLCDFYSQTSNQDHAGTIKEIVDYISEQYHNSDLSLDVISNRFNTSPSYMSQLFKDKTGDNLFSFIEKIRIEKALNLLLQQNLSINQIALMVGYNSDKSFRRAFKRVNGTSPTLYRVKIKEADHCYEMK